mgnify:CR=1 FL=1
MNLVNQILQRWRDIVIPAAVFLAALIITLWLRRVAYKILEKWAKATQWEGYNILVRATRLPSLLICVLIGFLLALAVSTLPQTYKLLTNRILWSLFVLFVAQGVIVLARDLIQLYLKKLGMPPRFISISSNVTVTALLAVSLLEVLDIWGVPTGPLVLFIGIIVLIILLASRDALSGLFDFFQLSSSGKIKAGDYIKLESGEEGYVIESNWRHTQLEALDSSIIIIPNQKLTRSKVINYGRPLKQASEPFRFFTRLHLKELTNLRARNLRELVDILKKAPDSVVYYHTHHFIEEHHYLTPEPPNDFAVWVTDALGNEALGEKLASLDTFEFTNLGALRDRLVGIAEEFLARDTNSRETLPGREFHFIRSVSIILPLPYLAHDLREFVEVLRNVSLRSLYFHIFESRLRLGRGLNDFSAWIEEYLDEPELADSIAHLDPYNYTLEGLRSSLIQQIEKHIK